jgi:hypothetical protein
MAAVIFPPVACVANAALPPQKRFALLTVLQAPHSRQFPLLLDVGRVNNVNADLLNNTSTAHNAQLAVALNIVRIQRSAVHFAGFKRRAGLALFRPLPGGQEDDKNFMWSDEFREALHALVDRTAAEMHLDARSAFKLRVDVVYVFEEAGDDSNVVHGQAVPYIFSSKRMGGPPIVTRGAAAKKAVNAIADELQNCLDHAIAGTEEGGSDLTLSATLGAMVWTTPTFVARAQGARDKLAPAESSFKRSRAGLLPDNPKVDPTRDKRCIARAIVSALDPQLHARLGSSLVSIRTAALKGAEDDLVKHTARRSVALESIRSRLDVAREALARAKRVAVDAGYDPEAAAHAHARFPAIEKALGAALRGEVGSARMPDLSSPFFSCEQAINEDSVAFIRQAVAPVNVRVNFWMSYFHGGVGLLYRDPEANLAFLEGGGRIVNLLVGDGHVNAISSVTTLSYPVAASNQHKYCDLCGFEVPHTTPQSTFQWRTLLLNHMERGCSLTPDSVALTTPLSRDNVRNLESQKFRACFDVSAHLTLAIDEDCLVSVAGTLATPWFPAVPLPPVGASDKVAALTSFLARWAWGHLAIADPVHLRKEFMSVYDRDPEHRLVVHDVSCSAVAPVDLTPALMRSLKRVVLSLCSPGYSRLLLLAGRAHFPRLTPGTLSKTCFYCGASVSGPSRDVLLRTAAAALDVSHFAEADEDEGGSSSGEPVIFDSDATTGEPVSAHADCAAAARGQPHSRFPVTVDVAEQSTLNALLEVVCHRHMVEEVCGGNMPFVARTGTVIRSFVLQVPIKPSGGSGGGVASAAGSKRRREFDDDDSDDGARGKTSEQAVLFLRFRGPAAYGFKETEWAPVFSAEGVMATGARALAYGEFLRAWNTKERAASRLSPLFFETAVSYSRAALLHSARGSAIEPLTSLTSAQGLAFVNRVAKGGRLLTGCAVVHAPLLSPAEDRRTVRLALDFTAKYPDVLQRMPLPHQEHTFRQLCSYAGDLAGGVAYIKASNPKSPDSATMCLEISGAFPVALHPRLAQFPPLFSRLPVPSSAYTPFQRLRLRLSLAAPPVERSVGHLFPLKNEVVFMREAKLLERLGFVFTHVGAVWGCKSSFWARDFSIQAERRRREAAARGDETTVAAVKLLVNSVIGAMNMNTADRTDLKAVLTEDIVFEDGLATGALGLVPGDARSDRRSTRLADDPRFTGRVFTAGDVTMVEMLAKQRAHTQMTVFALAVQAYARCDHAELWYGDGVRRGIVDVFPAAKLLYGNTDSVFVEVSVPAGDARVVLWRGLRHWLDLSNVPETSSLWAAMSPDERVTAKAEAALHAGEWGRVKEETGFAGIDAFVVNGPNRYAYRVIQSVTDTLPKHVHRSDVLKSLPAAWINTSVEQYAVHWAGGHTEEEREALAEALPAGVPVPVDGTCRWGNHAAMVARSGAQWPLGADPSQFPALAAALEDLTV